jgi:hypothetical protein
MYRSIITKVFPIAFRSRIRRQLNWKRYADRFEAAIQQFVVEKGITDLHEVELYRKKLIKAFVRDNWYPDEYFFFNYEHLSRKGVLEFVPNREANMFWNHQNTKEIYHLTCDKALTYQYFKDYFNRDAVFVSSGNSQSVLEFEKFTERHHRFIVKPNFGNLGNGIQIINLSEQPDKSVLKQELLKTYPDGFIAEELIVQCSELAAFHPSSVNTLRLTTVRQSNGDIYLIHRAFFRIGQGGRCVDNGGNGGIFAGIDYETGIVKGAIDERMNRYIVHPDTKKTILGFQIPRWEEAKDYAVKLAKVLPNLNYCGWDIALTDKGWVMVEANGKGLFIGFQMPTQEGFREEFESIKLRCGYYL